MSKPCTKCGKPIVFATTVPGGKNVALDADAGGAYVLAGEPGRRDPGETRVEYKRVWKAHAESCGK